MIRFHTARDGRKRIKLAQPCFWATTKAYILRKASPYTARFNRVIMKVAESGIEVVWWNHYLHEYAKEIFAIRGEAERNKNNSLEDTSLESNMFFIGMLGYLTALCAFIGELAVRWAMSHAKKKGKKVI